MPLAGDPCMEGSSRNSKIDSSLHANLPKRGSGGGFFWDFFSSFASNRRRPILQTTSTPCLPAHASQNPRR